MNSENTSLWTATTPRTNYDALKGTVHVDIAVVGGGITGLTAAILLKRAGKKVAVVEKARVATGESGQTTAHLTEIIDTRFHVLLHKFGRRGARLAAQSGRASIAQIAQLVRELEIDCGFQHVPAYLYAESWRDVVGLKRELRAMDNAGLVAEWVADVPLPFSTHGAIRVENQAQFHPVKYLTALAAVIHGNGSFVFEKSRAVEMRDGDPCRVTCENGSVVARNIIVAANVPVSNKFFLITKLAPYRTYAIAAKREAAHSIQPGLYWDNRDPYHYIRIQDEHILIGGEDHKTGMVTETGRQFENLADYARKFFGVREVEYRWSGQVIESVDGLPYIGKNSLSSHEWVATGYSGNGMTFGTVAGMLLAELVQGKAHPWKELYSPTRLKPLASAKNFIMENIDFPTCLIKDKIRPADASSLKEVAPGEGKIVNIDGQKVAVFHDESGSIQMLSPACPHMGCHVHFNQSERTWDCPCHGSRFDTDGRVLNGPAVADLKPVDTGALQKKKDDAA